MARSLNKVQLIGNLTRDPELRYTPNGAAVCSFGLATNRTWVTEGEKKEDTEFHNIVAWNKLAEICSQFLAKGRKVYVEGRITTRTWAGQDGSQKSRVEIVAENMIILDSRDASKKVVTDEHVDGTGESSIAESVTTNAPKKKESKEPEEGKGNVEEVNPDDIPF